LLRKFSSEASQQRGSVSMRLPVVGHGFIFGDQTGDQTIEYSIAVHWRPGIVAPFFNQLTDFRNAQLQSIAHDFADVVVAAMFEELPTELLHGANPGGNAGFRRIKKSIIG
jgi:hypothetical protein